MKFLNAACILVAGALPLAGCYVEPAPQPVAVYRPAPAVVVQRPPPVVVYNPPVRVWVPGHYGPYGGWIPGHYRG